MRERESNLAEKIGNLFFVELGEKERRKVVEGLLFGQTTMRHPENRYVGMSIFSEGSAGSLAMQFLDIEGKNAVSEECIREVEKTRIESIGKESNSWGLSSVLTQRELDVLIRGYRFSERVEARLARRNEMARVSAKGYSLCLRAN